MSYFEIKEALMQRGDELSLAAAKAIEDMYQTNLSLGKERDKLRESNGWDDGYLAGFNLGVQIGKAQNK